MRKIIHIDMDAFYASVEQRDHPEWKGKPVVVSGPPNSRSVVATASYEARKFGIHSAMPSREAYKLCPHAIFALPRFQAYKEVSKEIQKIFYEYTDLVEPLSLDEAYLDVTENKFGIEKATTIAREIKKKIFEKTELTSTAGVASGKFIAKVASGMNKPDGLTVILPEQAEKFMEELAIGKFYGIGKVTEKKMISYGIKNGKDLKEKSIAELCKLLGKHGSYYYDILRGIDNSKVIASRQRKSVGVEETFAKDSNDKNELLTILEEILHDLVKRIEKANVKGKTITLKVKYSDFHQITRSNTLPVYIHSLEQIYPTAYDLFNGIELHKKVRLLGLSLSSLEDEAENKQGNLF
jgi:DNA polymerase-4